MRTDFDLSGIIAVVAFFAAAALVVLFFTRTSKPMRTDFDFRRTVTTIAFCGAGMAILPVIVWMTHLIRSDAPHVFALAMGMIVLLGIVLVGLSFTVAMRQISGSFMGNTFSASGGDDDDDGPPTVTTTTETKVTPQ